VPTTTTTLPPVNNPPVLDTLADQITNEDGYFGMTVTATDPDFEFRTMSASGLPSWAFITAVGDGTITIEGTPSFDDAGATVVTVQVTDPNGATDSGSFTITVESVNRAPTFVWPLIDQANSVGDTVDISPRALDPDGDVLTWSAGGLPQGITINPANGTISGTIGSAGFYTVTVTVRDPEGGADLTFFNWDISE
jgi:glycine cleavage system H lipoate-binding protein